MNATVAAEALWLRALRVADARGLLPANKSRLTPAELAAEAGVRGEDRLARLVDGWYYPASYGGVLGVLSEEEATRLVSALEAEIAPSEVARVDRTSAQDAPPTVDYATTYRKTECELCGFPLTPGAWQRRV